MSYPRRQRSFWARIKLSVNRKVFWVLLLLFLINFYLSSSLKVSFKRALLTIAQFNFQGTSSVNRYHLKDSTTYPKIQPIQIVPDFSGGQKNTAARLLPKKTNQLPTSSLQPWMYLKPGELNHSRLAPRTVHINVCRTRSAVDSSHFQPTTQTFFENFYVTLFWK